MNIISAHQLQVTCDPLPFSRLSLFHLSLQVFTPGSPPVGQHRNPEKAKEPEPLLVDTQVHQLPKTSLTYS